MHKISPPHGSSQTGTNYTDETSSSLIAQMRTLGPTATNTKRRAHYQPGQTSSMGKNASRMDVGDEYSLITPATNSSAGWAAPNEGDERDLESRPPVMDTQLTSSSRLQEWREKWPVIEMFSTFEKSLLQTAWFGPLMIAIVVLLFAATTIVGLMLLVITAY